MKIDQRPGKHISTLPEGVVKGVVLSREVCCLAYYVLIEDVTFDLSDLPQGPAKAPSPSHLSPPVCSSWPDRITCPSHRSRTHTKYSIAILGHHSSHKAFSRLRDDLLPQPPSPKTLDSHRMAQCQSSFRRWHIDTRSRLLRTVECRQVKSTECPLDGRPGEPRRPKAW